MISLSFLPDPQRATRASRRVIRLLSMLWLNDGDAVLLPATALLLHALLLSLAIAVLHHCVCELVSCDCWNLKDGTDGSEKEHGTLEGGREKREVEGYQCECAFATRNLSSGGFSGRP